MDSPRFKPPLTMALTSVHPPSPTHGDAADPSPSWAILDFHAYVADRRNSTTAACKTSDGDAIQVTVFPAAPPRVSYLCVHCPGVDPCCFAVEPRIVAVGDDALVFCLIFGSHEAMLKWRKRTPAKSSGLTGGNGEPLLELLPRPGRCLFFDEQASILSRGAGRYTIVALRDDRSAFHHGFSQPGHYDVCLLHSEDKVWTTNAVFVPPDQQQLQHSSDGKGFLHNVQGDHHGRRAWHHGLRRPLLRHPAVRCAQRHCIFYARITRDIALIQGRFRLVEIQMKCLPPVRVANGWVAVTWSRPATFSQEDSWHLDRELKSCDVKVGHNPQLLELLPKVPDNEGKPQVILGRLYTDHPLLSLHEDGLVYLMTKPRLDEKKAWLIAVDMGEGTLNGVADIAPGRPVSTKCAYTQSQISKHLNMAPGVGSKDELKRPGTPLLGSSRKKSHIPKDYVAAVGAEDNSVMNLEK
ncbi:hypothetical protein ACP4OV_031466 [Aristida adscensionis]